MPPLSDDCCFDDFEQLLFTAPSSKLIPDDDFDFNTLGGSSGELFGGNPLNAASMIPSWLDEINNDCRQQSSFVTKNQAYDNSANAANIGLLPVEQQNYGQPICTQLDQQQQVDTAINSINNYYNLSAYPSPPTSHHQPDNTPPHGIDDNRTNSTSSIEDDDCFNPQEFIKLIGDLPPNNICNEGNSSSNCSDDGSISIKMESQQSSASNSPRSDSVTRFYETDTMVMNHDGNGGYQNAVINQNFIPESVNLSSCTLLPTIEQMIPPEQNLVSNVNEDGFSVSANTFTPHTITAPPNSVNIKMATTPIKLIPSRMINCSSSIKINDEKSKQQPSLMMINTKPIQNGITTINLNSKSNKLTKSNSLVTGEQVQTSQGVINNLSKAKTVYLSTQNYKTLMNKINSNTNRGTTSSTECRSRLEETVTGTTTEDIKPRNKTNTIDNNGSPNKSFIKSTEFSAANGKILTGGNLGPKVLRFIPSNGVVRIVHELPTNNNRVGESKKSSMPTPSMKGKNSMNNSTNEKKSFSKSNTGNGAGGQKFINTGNNQNRAGSPYKDIIDEKLLKKQQRMLKNRESASLSRKKRKEYMERLENQISCLEKENYQLKGVRNLLIFYLIYYKY